MDPIVMVLIVLALGIIMPIIGSILKKKRAGSEKYQQIMADFQQKVNQELAEDETVEAMCGYVPCAALTNQRLLISTKEGIDSIQFSEIKSLKGMNAGGNKTKNPHQMLVFQIKANKKYTLGNHSDGFSPVVEGLFARMEE